jgi:hypothetical protein
MRERREVPVFEYAEAAASKMGMQVRDLLETSQCGFPLILLMRVHMSALLWIVLHG